MKNKEKFKDKDYDPLDAIPMVSEGVDAKKDNSGCFQIRKRIQPPRGLRGKIYRKLGYKQNIRVNLDKRGTEFWEKIDGRKKLRRIEKELRKVWGVERDESREAVTEFTKTLMTRHLVDLDISQTSRGKKDA